MRYSARIVSALLAAVLLLAVGLAAQKTDSAQALANSAKPARGCPKPGCMVCTVDTARELMITNTSVVDYPLRTTWNTDPAVDPRAASWTFGRLMQKIAGLNDAQVMTRTMLDTWMTDQVINGQTIAARPKMQVEIINPWLAASGSTTTLDLRKAPFLLVAIVSRLDLRDLSQHSAGQVRFNFQNSALTADGFHNQFLVILEFNLYAADQAAINKWASDFHALGSLTIGSTAYNDALGAITDRATAAGSDPVYPNSAPLISLRTEEITLDPATETGSAQITQWRHFQTNEAGTLLTATTLPQTPVNSSFGTARLADFINQNEQAILANTYVVPDSFEEAPFAAGAVFAGPKLPASTVDRYWDAPGIANPNARQQFSINTCNGCHGAETGTAIAHAYRPTNAAATLSGYLTGIKNVSDPSNGVKRSFNVLADRADDFKTMVCP